MSTTSSCLQNCKFSRLLNPFATRAAMTVSISLCCLHHVVNKFIASSWVSSVFRGVSLCTRGVRDGVFDVLGIASKLSGGFDEVLGVFSRLVSVDPSESPMLPFIRQGHVSSASCRYGGAGFPWFCYQMLCHPVCCSLDGVFFCYERDPSLFS